MTGYYNLLRVNKKSNLSSEFKLERTTTYYL